MKQILCFGDSNTWGYNGENGERFPWGVRWTGLLQEKFAENRTEVRIIEEGLVGRTTVFEDPLRDGRKGTALFPTILETHAPVDAIVLMLGTNDCKTIFKASLAAAPHRLIPGFCTDIAEDVTVFCESGCQVQGRVIVIRIHTGIAIQSLGQDHDRN